jgi:hypothetical protein
MDWWGGDILALAMLVAFFIAVIVLTAREGRGAGHQLRGYVLGRLKTAT